MSREQRNKVAVKWIGGYGYSEEEIQRAWDNAIEQGNGKVIQLERSECTWRDLNALALNHLLLKYGVKAQ